MQFPFNHTAIGTACDKFTDLCEKAAHTYLGVGPNNTWAMCGGINVGTAGVCAVFPYKVDYETLSVPNPPHFSMSDAQVIPFPAYGQVLWSDHVNATDGDF
ncbi:hypothetical protein HDU76_001848, partial [Blyttiomyces sp. JEL0837]